jgi:shikimate kinase
VDTDELIVATSGKTIREIFDQHGERGFRDVESQVVADVCQLPDHIIALGGGAVLREQNRRAIKEADLKVIYLRCEPEELAKRIQSDPNSAAARPNLTPLGGGPEEIRKLLSEREPIYRSVMTAELDVTHLTPQDAVVYITRLL